MIDDMITRLLNEANEDAQHEARKGLDMGPDMGFYQKHRKPGNPYFDFPKSWTSPK